MSLMTTMLWQLGSGSYAMMWQLLTVLFKGLILPLTSLVFVVTLSIKLSPSLLFGQQLCWGSIYARAAVNVGRAWRHVDHSFLRCCQTVYQLYRQWKDDFFHKRWQHGNGKNEAAQLNHSLENALLSLVLWKVQDMQKSLVGIDPKFFVHRSLISSLLWLGKDFSGKPRCLSSLACRRTEEAFPHFGA